MDRLEQNYLWFADSPWFLLLSLGNIFGCQSFFQSFSNWITSSEVISVSSVLFPGMEPNQRMWSVLKGVPLERTNYFPIIFNSSEFDYNCLVMPRELTMHENFLYDFFQGASLSLHFMLRCSKIVILDLSHDDFSPKS